MAQGRPTIAPAEPPPADYAGTEWRDSQGCQFVRSNSGGTTTWLPVLDAQRQPVCGLPPLAAAQPENPAPENPAPDPPGTPTAEGDPIAALSRLADLDTGTGARLIFVEPDNRVRIIYVDMPSVLVGGDPFGMNDPMPAVTRGPARGALVGYHPQPARLQVAPPIHGFGTDP